MKSFSSIILFTLLSCCLSMAQNKETVLLEAESFQDRGGWVVDPQFMDQMGSPYLLAHGIGKPVGNARTTVSLPKKGTWHVYARTWNWCAPWGIKDGPGKFRIAVNGETLDQILGKGKQWGWEYAGSFQASGKEATVELCDLTGFEGRCDAILLTRNPSPVLPDEPKALQAFRRKLLRLPEKPRSAGDFDLVVVGAGVAGISTAIKGAREGLKVALINNRPVPGGNNSTELRILASGKMNVAPYERLGDVTGEIINVYDKE